MFSYTFRQCNGLAILIVVASALVSACGNPPDDSPAKRAEQRLVGTWLREYRQESADVRRVLVLLADGSFQESATVTESGLRVAQHVHAGRWHFDGTNLKRRYTSVDGSQPKAPMVPFATFELKFESPREFVGIDRVRRREVHYHRVAEGTLP